MIDIDKYKTKGIEQIWPVGGLKLINEEEIAKLFRKLINLLNEDEAKEIDKLLLKVQSRLLKEEE